MASVLKNSDFNLVHRYLCGDKEAGSELYASIFPIVKGFIYSHKNAADIAKDHKAGDEMGLSVEGKAFYDALLKPAAIKYFFQTMLWYR